MRDDEDDDPDVIYVRQKEIEKLTHEHKQLWHDCTMWMLNMPHATDAKTCVGIGDAILDEDNLEPKTANRSEK